MKSSICKTFSPRNFRDLELCQNKKLDRNDRLVFEPQDMKIDRMDELKNVESAASVSSGGSNNGGGRGAANTTSTDLNYSIKGLAE